MPVTASFETPFQDDIKWEEVENRVTEEVKNITTGTSGIPSRETAAH